MQMCDYRYDAIWAKRLRLAENVGRIEHRGWVVGHTHIHNRPGVDGEEGGQKIGRAGLGAISKGGCPC